MSFAGWVRGSCSPVRAGFQGGINGALPRVGHCVRKPQGELVPGGGDTRRPRAGSGGHLHGKVLQSWRAGAVPAASTAWRPPLFHPGSPWRGRDPSPGIQRGGLLPRGGPWLRLFWSPPFSRGGPPRSSRRWPGREVLPAGESYSGPELQHPLSPTPHLAASQPSSSAPACM